MYEYDFSPSTRARARMDFNSIETTRVFFTLELIAILGQAIAR